MRETVRRERKGKGLLLRGRDEGIEGGKGNGGSRRPRGAYRRTREKM